jgi:hypothetical protein
MNDCIFIDGEGRIRQKKGLDEELVPLSKAVMREGSLVGIVSGKHDGLYARVVRMSLDDKVLVKLDSSEQVAYNDRIYFTNDV